MTYMRLISFLQFQQTFYQLNHMQWSPSRKFKQTWQSKDYENYPQNLIKHTFNENFVTSNRTADISEKRMGDLYNSLLGGKQAVRLDDIVALLHENILGMQKMFSDSVFFFYQGFLSQTRTTHRTAGEGGGDHLLFHSTTSTHSRTFRHLFATLHAR